MRGFLAYDGSRAPKPPFALNTDSPQADRLVLHYGMMSLNENTLFDLGPNKKNVILESNPPIVAVRHVNTLATNFTGDPDKGELVSNTVTNFADDLSLMVHFVENGAQASNSEGIFGGGYNISTGADAGWSFGLENTSKYRFNISDAIAGFDHTTMTDVHLPGTGTSAVQTMIVTYDRANDTVRFYVDGVLKDTDSNMTVKLAASSNPIIVASSQVLDRFFKMKLIRAVLWRKVLSPVVVSSLNDPATRWDLYHELNQRQYYRVPAAAATGSVVHLASLGVGA